MIKLIATIQLLVGGWKETEFPEPGEMLRTAKRAKKRSNIYLGRFAVYPEKGGSDAQERRHACFTCERSLMASQTRENSFSNSVSKSSVP